MPWRYVIDKERRLVISTGWDILSFTEIKSHEDRLKNDPNFAAEFSQLVDLIGVTKLDLSTGEARMLASGKLASFSASSRRAFVATNPYIFGMYRMLEVYTETAGRKDQARVFYDRDAALKWLGLNDLPR